MLLKQGLVKKELEVAKKEQEAVALLAASDKSEESDEDFCPLDEKDDRLAKGKRKSKRLCKRAASGHGSTDVRAGLEAALAANEASLVQFVLASLDDAYDDGRQASNTQVLLCSGAGSTGPAFAIAGSVGSLAGEAALATLLASAGSDGVPVLHRGLMRCSSPAALLTRRSNCVVDERKRRAEEIASSARLQGSTLHVDTWATGAVEPTYSCSAGGLLFPVRDYAGDGAGPVSTSRALDVMAHTAGYAVLDALRPAWAQGLAERPEGGVLHEAFADLMALLVALGTPAVCGTVVAQTRCDLHAEVVAQRQQVGMADALRTRQLRQTARRWGSHEVSAMITCAVWGTIAAELAPGDSRTRRPKKKNSEALREQVESTGKALLVKGR
eukprot:m51a1_g11427 hypothetical protein (385) ;mRNA; f:2470-7171